jgi:hypothetical protein
MNAVYHRQILARAIGARISPRALAAITRANLNQDRPAGLFFHSEYHFDENGIAQGLAYIEACRAGAVRAAVPTQAWAAFGRLTHAAQDFYAHSNYVRLWEEQFDGRPLPEPRMLDGLDPRLLNHPRLMSCRVYYPLEILYFVPGLEARVTGWLPDDSHARLNLDKPGTGPLFPYAMEAAVQRTVAEFERTLAILGEERGEAAVRAFTEVW